MRANQKVIRAGLLGILLLAGAVAVVNAQNLKRQQKGGEALALRAIFVAGLDLTDPQKEQIRTVLSNHKSEISAVVQSNLKARKGLRQALTEGTDQASLKAAYDEVSSAGWNTLLLRKNLGAEIMPILTAEQQAKLQKRLQNINRISQLVMEKRLQKKLGI